MATDYGSDFSTFTAGDGTADLDYLWRPISGRRVVAEAVARRLITKRGTLPGYPNYGAGIPSWLSSRTDAAALRVLEAQIAQAAREDERVENASATVQAFAETIQIKVSCTTADGPFSLVLEASKVSVSVLRIE